MNLTAEQLQIASITDAKRQKLVCDGNDDHDQRARILNRKHGRREKLNNAPFEPRLAAAGQINKSHMASRFWRFEEQTRILFCFRKGKASRCEKG
jgi:hypothetical protein